MYTDPPFTQCAKKGWQSTRLELRIPAISLKFCGSGPEKTGDSPQKTKTTSGDHLTTPPPGFDSYIPIDSFRRQDSDYISL